MSNMPDLLSQRRNADHLTEMRRQVEQDRLVAAIRASAPRRAALYSRLLGWLGDQLIVLGQRLKVHSGTSLPTLLVEVGKGDHWG